MIIFDTLAGIGDVSWVYSKIVNLTKTREVGLRICDDPPARCKDFVDLLPGIKNMGYGRPDRYITNWLPYDADLAGLQDGEYGINLNWFLEAGMRIETIFPHQPTQYHYAYNTERYRSTASELLERAKGKRRIGFFCDSKHGNPRRRFWPPEQWADFFLRVAKVVPEVSFFALGASWDTRTANVAKLLQGRGLDCISLVGQTSIGATVEVLRGLNYFFVVNAGLGMICDVLNVPTFMWYWGNYADEPWGMHFPDSYADPENVKFYRHINFNLAPVDKSFNHFQEFGQRWALA